MKMPIRDPGLWSIFWAWVADNYPTLYGMALSVITAAIRITYGGGSKRQLLSESLFCGAISLTLSSGLEHLGLPSNLAPFVGGVTGFLGVEKIREIADTIIGRRVNKEQK